MNDIKRKTILTIADFEFPYWVEFGGKEEELTRKAVRMVNACLNTYRSTFPNQTKEKYLAMVAFDLCYRWLEQEDRNDTKPFVEKLRGMETDLDELLEKE